jgi:hypothetical protein
LRTALTLTLCLLAALLAATSAQAASCPGEAQHEQRFADWGDDGDYFLAPGGDFESADHGWVLQRGAAPLAGASPDGWGVSLAIPPAAQATSPAICVAPGYEHARMFGQAIAALRGLGSLVKVDVLDAETNARLTRLPSLLGVDRRWDPTSRFLLGEDLFDLDPLTGLGAVRLRFTGLGPATALVDGVYVDPSARN